MKDKKICLLGGDSRMLYAMKAFEVLGFQVSSYGLTERDPPLNDAACNASALVLPLPLTTDGIRLFAPLCNKDIRIDEIVDILSPGQLVAGGKLAEQTAQRIADAGCIPFDYYLSERLTVLNAIPTAEGAIAIAVNKTAKTIFGSSCTVAGYGRIGRILARLLRNMGASVTVLARRDEALTWAEAEGGIPVPFSSPRLATDNADIIFNTIPSPWISRDIIDHTKTDTVIIDLASSPGGIDPDCAKSPSRKIVYALSLPGKVAPETSGEIIAKCVISRLSEVGI